MTVDVPAFHAVGETLQKVADQLLHALDSAGYVEKGFYCVPGGFALATRVERIEPLTKTPWPGDRRWETGPEPLLDFHDGLSLHNIMEALTAADAGRYRMIVFYVTNINVQPTDAMPTPDFASLPSGGDDQLPHDFDHVTFGPDYRVRAFVYEFRRASVHTSASFVAQTLPTLTHLQRAGIWTALH